MVANRDFQQAVNKALILQAVLDGRGNTRPALARELGMYRSTVSNLVEVLLDEGWLIQEGTAEMAGAGRRATVLELNRKKGCMAGLAIRGPGSWDALILDPTGEVLAERQSDTARPTPDVAKEGPGVLRESVDAALAWCEEQAGGAGLPLLGAGVSVSGPVDNSRQRIIYSEAFGLRDLEASAFIDPRPYPVRIENDSQSCAWGKAWQSGNRGGEDFAYLYLNRRTGTGQDIAFGLGLFLDGRAYHGAHRYAGEIPTRFGREIDRRFAGREAELLNRLLNFDRRSRRILADLADGLVDMIQFLDPHRFYLGHHLEPFKEAIDDYLAERSREILFDVEFAGLGRQEAAFGAGCYMLYNLYTVPRPGGEVGWSIR